MGLIATKVRRDLSSSAYIEIWSVTMNGASSGTFQTGLLKIDFIGATNETSATPVRAMPNSSNGTANSSNGYVYITDATTSDTISIKVEGI